MTNSAARSERPDCLADSPIAAKPLDEVRLVVDVGFLRLVESLDPVVRGDSSDDLLGDRIAPGTMVSWANKGPPGVLLLCPPLFSVGREELALSEGRHKLGFPSS